MHTSSLLSAYGGDGELIARIDGDPKLPRLVVPEEEFSSHDFRRLVVFAPYDLNATSYPSKHLVLDVCGPSQHTWLTIEADDNGQVRRILFSGYLRVYLGVGGRLRVHGELRVVNDVLRWTLLHIHYPHHYVSYDVDDDIADVTKELGARSPSMAFASLLKLRLSVRRPEYPTVEFVSAPVPGPTRYTGENLRQQLTNKPSSGVLVLRLRQRHRLSALEEQVLECPELRVVLSTDSIKRGRLNGRASVSFVQTLAPLDEDGELSPSIGSWIVRFDGVPIVPGLAAYNASAVHYMSSLQTTSDGRPISALPLFDDRIWDASENAYSGEPAPADIEFRRRWWMSFDFHDTFPESLPHSTEGFLSRGNIRFRAATLRSREDAQSAVAEQYKYATTFPGLLRHDFYLQQEGELGPPYFGTVKIDSLIEQIEEIGEASIESLNRGFSFAWKPVFRERESAQQPAEWIRVGALDIGFAPSLDPLPADFFDGGELQAAEAQQLTARGILNREILEQRQLSVVTLGWRPSRGNWMRDVPLVASNVHGSDRKIIWFSSWNRGVPTVAIEAVFILDAVTAGGQDGLPDEEFRPVDVDDSTTRSLADDSPSAISRRFVRENPVVIHTGTAGNGTKSGPFLLRIREHTSDMQSQALAMNLFEVGARSVRTREATHLVTLDRQPFMVALVSAPPFAGIAGADGNLEVGNWSSAGFEGASWELAGASDGFVLRFPPQAIGENMEKLAHADSIDNKPSQFRLGPTSSFEIESSYFRQNFTEAAWNLRRILGYPGQRAPGAGIKGLEFELLYGMGCEVRALHLRLAELASRLGAVPGSLPQNISNVLGVNAESLRVDILPVRERVFRRLDYRWSRQFIAYMSRLGVFEPYRNFAEPSVTLRSRVQYLLRAPDRIAQDPSHPEQHSENQPQPRLLGGGALWGFDFESQYKPFKVSAETRRSTDGELSRPAFSALGGWGYQKAVFQNGLTTIYSDTAMGRTFFYSVERKGRIAGFWNFAKHVVIYERTVGTAKQFRPLRNEAGDITVESQDHLAGRPVLRKVREFVEVLQPRRSYPDLDEGIVERGCVQGIEFSTTVIPIDYRWGTDVFDPAGEPIGYIIPLWHPEADPEIYPKPAVAVRISGAESSNSTMGCEIVDPQRLAFYSQADNTTGEEVNTDDWLAVRGVDYPDAAWPAPETLSTPSNGTLEQPLPDEVAVAPGYAAFTYSIRAPRAANVVVNRSDEVTAAFLRNVSMVRANPMSAVSSNADAVAATAVVSAQGSIARTRDLTRQLIGNVRSDLADPSIQTQIVSRVSELNALVTSVGTDLHLAFQDEDSLLNTPRNWGRLTRSSIDRWQQSAQAIVAEQFGGQLRQQIESLDSNVARARSQARRAVQESWDILRLAAPSLDPGIEEIQNRLNRSVELLDGLPRAVRSVIDELTASVEQLFDYPLFDVVPPPEDRERLKKQASSIQQRIVNLVRQAVDQATDDLALHLADNVLAGAHQLVSNTDRALSGWRLELIKELNRPVDEILEDFGKVDEIIPALNTAIQTTLATAREAIREFNAVLANRLLSIDVGGVTIDQLVRSDFLLEGCLAAISAETEVGRIAAHVDALIGQLESGISAIQNVNVQPFVDDLIASDKLVQPIANAEALPGKLADTIAGLSVNAVQQLLANGDLDTAKRELEQLVGNARSKLEGVLGNLSQPLSGRFPAGVVQKAGTTLRMVRAFGDAPLVQGMDFTRKRLGYFYDPLKALKGEAIGISPAVALVNRAGDHLKAMGVSLPTGELLDQVLPPADDLMKQIDFGSLLPDFAGLKLDKLLPDLKSPAALKDRVRVTQSFDKQSGRGWVQADVRVPVDGPSVLFDAGALQVSLRKVLLEAQIRIAAGVSGAPTHRQSGQFGATWDLTLGGNPLITFEDTTLSFDESGKTKFNLDPTKVRMNGILSLLSDVLKTVSTGGDGFILRLKEVNGLPVGVEALLDMPLPDLAFGAFALSNLRFGVQFELVALPEFAIGLSINVSKKTTPFTVTILLLGGGGWFLARGRYLPLSNRLTSAVSLGISAGAMLAIAFGPIKGSVFAFFYVEGELQTDSDNPGSRELIIRIGLILGGDVDAAGFATVSIRLLLEAEYDGGALTGRGLLSIKVKVCFFFTFRFSRTVEKRLAGNQPKHDPDHERRVQSACDEHLGRTAA